MGTDPWVIGGTIATAACAFAAIYSAVKASAARNDTEQMRTEVQQIRNAVHNTVAGLQGPGSAQNIVTGVTGPVYIFGPNTLPVVTATGGVGIPTVTVGAPPPSEP